MEVDWKLQWHEGRRCHIGLRNHRSPLGGGDSVQLDQDHRRIRSILFWRRRDGRVPEEISIFNSTSFQLRQVFLRRMTTRDSSSAGILTRSSSRKVDIRKWIRRCPFLAARFPDMPRTSMLANPLSAHDCIV